MSDNLWHTGNVTDISRSGIGWLVVFGGVSSLLVHTLILEEKASCLRFFDWIRYSAACFDARLNWLICANYSSLEITSALAGLSSTVDAALYCPPVRR